jgi:hypothetical protein
MAKAIDVMSLYPKDMNIYGDWGNVLTITRRLALYGYEPRLHVYNQGDAWPEHIDMILGGGGQDNGQKKITEDLFLRADELRSLAADGTPMLAICGLYQLFGEYFETIDGTRLDGIGIFGVYTKGRNVRMIGNLVEHAEQFGDVIGYENHSGQTFLREGVQPLGARGCRGHRQQRRRSHRRSPSRQRDRHLYARLAAAQEPGHIGLPHSHCRRTPLRCVPAPAKRAAARRSGPHRRCGRAGAHSRRSASALVVRFVRFKG